MIMMFNRRRLFIVFKYLILFLVFGVYFAILLRESMAAIKITHRTGTRRAQTEIRSKFLKKNVGDSSSSSAASKDEQNQSQDLPITFNPIYEYSEEINLAAERDFAERRLHLADKCQQLNLHQKYPPNAKEFFISMGHGITWCNVFKAASSTWMYYFNILGGYDLRYLQKTKSSPLELARRRFPRPTYDELMDALETSLSFLVVREPFERLLSAYRNKLEGLRNKYYKYLGEQIVKKFRTVAVAKKRGSAGPTFREFLLFLIDTDKTKGHFDEHWTPIYRFCTPCSINFTLIVKIETFQRDTEYIIRQTNLELLLLNKMPSKRAKAISNRAASDTKYLVSRYFSQIDQKVLEDLLRIYELDFELFGYDTSKYFNMIQKTTKRVAVVGNETRSPKLVTS